MNKETHQQMFRKCLWLHHKFKLSHVSGTKYAQILSILDVL